LSERVEVGFEFIAVVDAMGVSNDSINDRDHAK
jgi:hypothetical protein